VFGHPSLKCCCGVIFAWSEAHGVNIASRIAQGVPHSPRCLYQRARDPVAALIVVVLLLVVAVAVAVAGAVGVFAVVVVIGVGIFVASVVTAAVAVAVAVAV
jgi:hypothetical protein